MASLTIVYWRDIPSQVIVKSGRTAAKRELTERFIRAIDAAAMHARAKSADDYLADWRKSDPVPCGDDLDAGAFKRVHGDRNLHAIDAAAVEETPAVRVEPEDRRPLVLGVVTANPLEESGTVVDGVGHDVDLRVCEIHQPSVHPDLFDFFERHRKDLLVRYALRAVLWHRRAGAEDAPSIGAAE